MVTQSLLNQYRRQVEVASNDAKNYIQAITDAYKIAYPEASVADIRNYTLDAIKDAVNVFGGQSMLVANDFFEEIARQEGVSVETDFYSTFDFDKATSKVHYLAKEIVNGDIEIFNGKVQDLTAFYVKREAFCNLAKNYMKNGLRYARVPSGKETCAFCFMLASRGFVYWSEEEAGGDGHKYHSNCDCIIVPGFHSDTGIDEDTQIEGYEPSKLRERYNQCLKAVQTPEGFWDVDLYNKQLKAGITSDKWEKWKEKQLIKEINTRDIKWLWSGTFAKIDKSIIGNEAYESLKKFEKKTWSTLAEKHGLGFTILPEKSNAPANIDAKYKGELWELKNPKSGKHAVEDRIKEACDKWSRLGLDSSPKIILSNSESSRSDSDVFQEAIRRCEFYGADELIFVSHNGENLYRWKK